MGYHWDGTSESTTPAGIDDRGRFAEHSYLVVEDSM